MLEAGETNALLISFIYLEHIVINTAKEALKVIFYIQTDTPDLTTVCLPPWIYI